MGMVAMEGIDRVKSEKAKSAVRMLNHPEKGAKPQSKTDPLRVPAGIQEEKKTTLRYLDGWQRPMSLSKQTEEPLTCAKVNRTLAFHLQSLDRRS